MRRRQTLTTLCLAIASALLLLLSPAAAQPPFGGGGPAGAGGPDGFGAGFGHGPGRGGGQRLIEYLELTPEQEEAWNRLQEEFQAEARTFFQSLRETGESLRALLDTEAPDPFEVGELVISQHSQRRAFEAAREVHQQALKDLLHADQLQRYEAFLAARESDRPRGPRHGGGQGRRGGGQP